MTTRTVDSKGRISLGSRFANRTVLIEKVDATELRVTLAGLFHNAKSGCTRIPGRRRQSAAA